MQTLSKLELAELAGRGNSTYGVAALIDEVEKLSRTPKGLRNGNLNEAACKLGSLIASENLDEETVTERLKVACEENGLIQDDGIKHFHATLQSGLSKGKKSPRFPMAEFCREVDEISTSRRVNMRRAADIQPENVSWLWKGVLAKGAISILAGNPGLGKSQASLSVAASISSGGFWPASRTRAEAGDVIILSMEDTAEVMIVPRLKACDANLERVHIITTVLDEHGEANFNLERDIPLLEAEIERLGGVSLIIIDPITAYLGKSDANNSGEVRQITTALTALAHKHDLCVLMVSHLNKNQDKQATHRVLGSVSWIGAARTAFLIEKDGDQRCVMAPVKNNLAPDRTSFAFSVQSKTLPEDIETSFVAWEDMSESNTADQVLTNKRDAGDAMSEAREFVTELLKNGPVEAMLANKAANDNQISESTLKRAKRSLNVGAFSKDNITWFWDYKGRAA